MGYFVKVAENVLARTDEKLAQLLRVSLLAIHPAPYAEFGQTDELDACFSVKVDEFYIGVHAMTARGTDNRAAREFAMESFLPTDFDEESGTKNYAIEATQEDKAAVLADWLVDCETVLRPCFCYRMTSNGMVYKPATSLF